MTYIDKNIEDLAKNTSLKAFGKIYRITKTSSVKQWVISILIALVIFMLLPWTQNISTEGKVTTLRQEQRPQELNTILSGRIVKWYVKEGDMVMAGDTLVKLAETKVDYLDPNLLARTQDQLNAKQLSVENYQSKTETSDTQIIALQKAKDLKTSQLDNKIRQQYAKVRSDSMDMLAAKNELSIANEQFRRQRALYDSGLVSLTQLEQRNQAYQNAMAKKNSTEIKFFNAKQELLLFRLEQSGAIQEYTEKIAKAQGDRFQSLSQIAAGKGDVAKLQNQYINYDLRNKMYFLIAPQAGQITNAKKEGIGEMVKEGEMVLKIVPTINQYAVEIFIRPADLPLISVGQNVRFLFDGFPAIVFSGWPKTSYGTFGGKIVTIENSISDNGKFRVLVAEDKNDREWPKQLRIGTGTQGIALLKDVQIWYELWRNINGFPPDYYKSENDEKSNKK